MTIRDDIVGYLTAMSPAVSPSSSDALKLDHVLDSVDMFEFISYLESRFRVAIRDADVLEGHLDTLGSVVQLMERYSSAS